MSTKRQDPFCRHFPHLGVMNDLCEKGVRIQDMWQPGEPNQRLPCCDRSVAHTCPHHEPYIDAEIEAQEASAVQAIKALNAFMTRESEACLECGAHVDMLEKVGRCTYARPCNHRQFQGSVPDAWRVKK